jgi:SAM-dependent methyltransferase
MLARARREHPGLTLVRAAPGPLPFRDGAFDAATLFAVLTCVPGDEGQRALVAELRRVLRPGGGLYVSDLLLNGDARNLARYDAARGRGMPYGVFEIDEGAVLRHHDPAWIDELFRGWSPVLRTEFVATTMNGHTSRAFQLVLRC